MRLAIISDIHGNDLALTTVLSDLKQTTVDQMVCLGDAIQGGPQPAQVVAHLRELGCPIVMGNADAWMLTGIETGAEKFSEERRIKNEAIRQWQLTQLSTADQEFINAFKPTLTIPISSDRHLLCFHGSPKSFDDIIFPDTPIENVREFLGQPGPHWLCGGHTHLQQIRRWGNGFFFNPGSVGYAYSHDQTEDDFRADPWAEYALLTVEGQHISLEFRKIPIDTATLIQIHKDSGRPYGDDAAFIYRP
jgi:predicted phosphodiesterase